MPIHGLQKVTLLDYPDRIACSVFLTASALPAGSRFLIRGLKNFFTASNLWGIPSNWIPTAAILPG